MACCDINSPLNPDIVAYGVDCCRFQLKDGEGVILCEINLNNVNIYHNSGGYLGLDDGVSKKLFSDGDAVALGFADLADMEAYIITLRADCCGDEPEPPILPDPSDFELTCIEEDDNIYIIDFSSFPPLIKDFNGDVVDRATPTTCMGVSYDTEQIDFCIDGIDYTRNDCIKKDKDGVLESVTPFWTDITGTVVPDPTIGVDPLLIKKGVCEICNPAIESFYGDNATLAGYNKFTVDIPKCCSVIVTTSAGVITLPAKPTNWVFCENFDCDLTSYSVEINEGDCEVDNVFTILTKTK